MNSEPVLEFEALRALAGRYVRSALGRVELERVAPSNDRDAIETALAETAEGIEYLRAAAQPQTASRGAAIRISFTDIADPTESVARLRIEGATLEAEEIYELTRLLDLAAEARGVLVAAGQRFPRLAAHGAAIADLRELAQELSGRFSRAACLRITRVWPWDGYGATSKSSARESSTRSNAFSARIMRTARCRKISSPSAMTASSFPSSRVASDASMA
jgi:hypothetical protein